ncbi:MAG: AAA family ATPase [Magnetococcales bacterium]|nr:AAA family ATPase [Magnetococcales bacterium]NGZ04803.1 AAA family ATPase [Magnetococcales bacterium]
MRILQIRLQNLNSLAGEWYIDLTHSAYRADGIFLITGPTGAGKTTLFDAICLALYGATPRLGRITRTDNEIMSRLTGSCFAEVTFETPDGRFRCHWSQHRGRRKATGELQSPLHEIADVATGRILEERYSGVAKMVEQITGMDFDRFTRSMLLAQGRFAAFLHANSGERSALLEQITGTEIYSRISKEVHWRRGEERRQRDLLATQLEGLRLLEPAEEERLRRALAGERLAAEACTNRLLEIEQALLWWNEIKQLAEELQRIQGQMTAWSQRWERLTPERERLQRAQRTLEPRARHALLIQLRQAQQADQQTLEGQRPLTGSARIALVKAEQTLSEAKTDLEHLKKEQTITWNALRLTRALDVRLNEKKGPLQQAEHEWTVRQQESRTLHTIQQQAQTHLATTLQQQQKIATALALYPADQGLVEQETGIQAHLKLLHTLRTRRAARVQTAQSGSTQVTESQKTVTHLEAALTRGRAQLEEMLAQQEPTFWRTTLNRLMERQLRLEQLRELLTTRQAMQNGCNQWHVRHQTALRTLAEQEQSIPESEATLLALEQERNGLESRLAVIQEIQGLATARQRLQPDTPCPLCGSKEHPYATEQPPVVHATLTALQNIRAAWQQQQERCQQARLALAHTRQELHTCDQRLQELTRDLAGLDEACQRQCLALSVDLRTPLSRDGVEGLIQANRQQLEHAGVVVTTLDRLEPELLKGQQQLEAARHQLDSHSREQVRLADEIQQLSTQEQSICAELTPKLAIFGLTLNQVETLEKLSAILTERRKRWIKLDAQQKEQQEARNRLEWEINQRTHDLNRLDMESRIKERLCQELGQEWQRLQQERNALFGERDPDQEEQRLLQIMADAENRLQARMEEREAAQHHLLRLESQCNELERSMQGRMPSLIAEEAALLTELVRLGFADEADFCAACLPEEQRQALLNQERQLADEGTALRSVHQAKTAQWNVMQGRRISDQPVELLQQVKHRLLARQRLIQGEIGGVERLLVENHALHQQRASQLDALERQQQECTRWEMLHGLIGSEDGKKYREFVQGLTFERVLGLANRHLRQMTERYAMVPDPGQPLLIRIIDQDQAGEVRSVRNLSGGETFLVSLALALGLSNLASQKIRVDSLFLDEGFGTLDEEALEIALETLAGLRRTGKLIGLISHVPALRERIATRIRVTPRSGGRSELSGPGCTKR